VCVSLSLYVCTGDPWIVKKVVVFGDSVPDDGDDEVTRSKDDEESSEEDVSEPDKDVKKSLKLTCDDFRAPLISKKDRTSSQDEIIKLLGDNASQCVSIVSGSVTVVFEQLPPGQAEELESLLSLDRSTCSDILHFCAKELGSSPSNLVPFFVKSSRVPRVIRNTNAHCFMAAIRLDETPSIFYCHRASRSIAGALTVLRELIWLPKQYTRRQILVSHTQEQEENDPTLIECVEKKVQVCHTK
jgi:hypothetical protein